MFTEQTKIDFFFASLCPPHLRIMEEVNGLGPLHVFKMWSVVRKGMLFAKCCAKNCGVSRIATKMRPSSVSGFSSRHKLRNPDRRS